MTVRALSSVRVADADDEAVLIDLRSGRYFGLNRTARAMWYAVLDSTTVQVALAKLCGTFDIDAVTLARDLDAFVATLAEQQLVETFEYDVG